MKGSPDGVILKIFELYIMHNLENGRTLEES